MSPDTVCNRLHINGKIFKVISSAAKGIIVVLDDKGEILIRKTNLTKEQVQRIEKRFLDFFPKKIHDKKNESLGNITDPMIG